MNLSALNKATAQTAPRTSGISAMMELELAHVYPNPDQPRKHFDPVSLAELAESIKSKGLMQPIVVTRKNDRYMIISGERRYRAHQINASITIRAIVTDRDDLSIDEMALIENIQRDDLTDYEIAMAIVRLWESGQYEQKTQLAQAIAKPLSYVSKAFACVNLDETIKSDIEENKSDIGLSVLQELSRVDPQKQCEVYDRYKAGEITRDGFKEAGKSTEPKVSQGEKQSAAEVETNKNKKDGYIQKSHSIIISHGEDCFLFNNHIYIQAPFQGFNNQTRYKITIEEIG